MGACLRAAIPWAALDTLDPNEEDGIAINVVLLPEEFDVGGMNWVPDYALGTRRRRR